MQLPKGRQISTSNDAKIQEWLTEIWTNSPALEGNVTMTLRTAISEMYARSVASKHSTPPRVIVIPEAPIVIPEVPAPIPEASIVIPEAPIVIPDSKGDEKYSDDPD